MPNFSLLPRTSFRQNIRGMHTLQVFNGVSLENVLSSGRLCRLLRLGELADGGGRRERPLENSRGTRTQLAPQHRGRHCRRGTACGRRRKWEGSVRSRCPRPISVWLLSPPSHPSHEVHYGGNARPLRPRRVRARRETLHRARQGRHVFRSQ